MSSTCWPRGFNLQTACKKFIAQFSQTQFIIWLWSKLSRDIYKTVWLIPIQLGTWWTISCLTVVWFAKWFCFKVVLMISIIIRWFHVIFNPPWVSRLCPRQRTTMMSLCITVDTAFFSTSQLSLGYWSVSWCGMYYKCCMFQSGMFMGRGSTNFSNEGVLSS